MIMAAGEYRLKPEEFPPDEEMERLARKCSLLAHCDNRPFSFCLKAWVNVGGDSMFRKVTYKHRYECIKGIR